VDNKAKMDSKDNNKIMVKVSNSKAVSKEANSPNKSNKIKAVKIKTVNPNNNRDRPKTVSKGNKVSKMTNNKVSN